MARRVASGAQHKAEANRPHQYGNEIGFQKRFDGIVYSTEHQVIQNFADIRRRITAYTAQVQREFSRNKKAGDHCDHRSRKCSYYIEKQHAADVRGLPLLVTCDGCSHQHENQHRRHGFQCFHEKLPEQTHRVRGIWGYNDQKHTSDNAQDNLSNKPQPH